MALYLVTQAVPIATGECILLTATAESILSMKCVTQCAEDFQETDPSRRVVLDLENVRLVNNGSTSVIVDFNRAT